MTMVEAFILLAALYLVTVAVGIIYHIKFRRWRIARLKEIEGQLDELQQLVDEIKGGFDGQDQD